MYVGGGGEEGNNSIPVVYSDISKRILFYVQGLTKVSCIRPLVTETSTN